MDTSEFEFEKDRDIQYIISIRYIYRVWIYRTSNEARKISNKKSSKVKHLFFDYISKDNSHGEGFDIEGGHTLDFYFNKF